MLKRKCLIFCSLVFALTYTFLGVADVRAQGRYKTELSKAEQAYSEGLFDQVIDLVKSCLSKGDLTTAEQAWAYKLLGQVYVSKNELQPAKICVQKLLEVAPDYEPDRDQDLQMWIELVEVARQERERQIQQQQLPNPPVGKPVDRAGVSKKGGGKKWLWIGGGGAMVAGAATFLILKGEDTRKRLPDPPAPPSRP